MTVVGSDGASVIVRDGCGLRRIDPATGGTITIATVSFGSGALVGSDFYGISNGMGDLYRVDLTTGTSTRLRGLGRYGAPVAADTNAVWMLWAGSLDRFDLATGELTTIGEMPATMSSYTTTMISVGGYLYASAGIASTPMLVRISKTDGSTRLVSGGGAATGQVTLNITGITSDGSKLFVSDSSSAGSWVKSITPIGALPVAPVATAPVMEAGAVAAVSGAGLSAARGVAVVGGAAFTADGNEVKRVDLATGAVTVLTGAAGDARCVDAATGAESRFDTYAAVTVVGSDGTFVITRDQCGLRRVDPTTGATITMTGMRFGSGTLVGTTFYGVDNGMGGLYRVDMTAGTRTRLSGIGGYGSPVAADTNAVWLLYSGSLQRYDLATGAVTTVATMPAILNNFYDTTTMISVGNYIYASAGSGTSAPMLVRISKSDGSTRLVSGGGAATGQVTLNITGITTDGTKLFVSDSSTAGHWVKSITPIGALPVAPIATAPVMDAGAVATVSGAGLSAARGVAVVGGAAFTADGNEIKRVDLATGAVSVLAGVAGDARCVDAATGAESRYETYAPVTVVGSDGTFVITRDQCGLRRVDPTTGATITMVPMRFGSGTLVGTTFYGVSNGMSGLYRVDMTAGTTTFLSGIGDYGAPVAADANAVWLLSSGSLKRFDLATHELTTLAIMPTTMDNSDTTMISVGDYIYASAGAGPVTAPMLLRISKTDGSTRLVSGGGAATGQVTLNITGITTDGTKLFVSDSSAAGSWVKSITPSNPLPVAPIATAPVMDAGAVATVSRAGLSAAQGVAVMGGAAFTADGNQIKRVDLATGAVSTLAGAAGDARCVDAAIGAESRFETYAPVTVVGSDGTFVITRDQCGLRRVDPTTGATITMTGMRFGSGTLVGTTFYGVDNGMGGLYRVDMTAGTRTRLSGIGGYGAPVAADTNAVWLLYSGSLQRFDLATGNLTTVGALPVDVYAYATTMISVGNYIYTNGMFQSAQYPYPQYTGLVRISKADGSTQLIAGGLGAGHLDGVYTDARFDGITGFAATGGNLFVADSSSSGGGSLRALRGVKLPTADGGPSLWRETTGGRNPSEDALCFVCEGDPVQTDTGALLEPASDLQLIGGRGTPAGLSRTYSSAAATTTNALGYGWAWSYGMKLSLPLTSVGTAYLTQENGSVAAFSRQADGSFTGSPRLRATLVANSDGTYTFTRKRELTMVFDSAGKLLSETDRHGLVTRLTYNSQAQVTQVTDPSGRTIAFGYDGAGLLSTATSPSGATVTYTHNPAGDLTAVADPTGAVTRYGYDSNHLLTAMTTPRGGVTSNVYDTGGRVISQTDPLGQVITFTYTQGAQSGDLTTTVVHPDGSRSIQQYLDGQLRTLTRAAGTTDEATVGYTYDPATSQKTTVTDPSGAVTRFTYDSDGNQLSATDPLGRTSRFTYDSLGNQTSATDAAGNTGTATYDTNGNRLSTTSPSGLVQRYTYNTDGTVATAATPGGHTTQYGYDTDGNLLRTTDPDGRTGTFTYDADGRPLTVTDPAAKVTTSSYDAAGRLTATTDPNNRTSQHRLRRGRQPHHGHRPGRGQQQHHVRPAASGDLQH